MEGGILPLLDTVDCRKEKKGRNRGSKYPDIWVLSFSYEQFWREEKRSRSISTHFQFRTLGGDSQSWWPHQYEGGSRQLSSSRGEDADYWVCSNPQTPSIHCLVRKAQKFYMFFQPPKGIEKDQNRWLGKFPERFGDQYYMGEIIP